MSDRIDCAVIGAGVVGLACARALAMAGRDVVILEAEDAIGMHASSRNSEVIHAGIYYPAGSLKARLCVRGKDLLYAYCAERGVGHRRTGKLLVATEEQETEALRGYIARAAANGVNDLRWLSRDECAGLEPAVQCVAGVFSPSTGIIDSHGLMSALLADAQSHGARLALGSPVTGGEAHNEGIVLRVGGRDTTTARCATVINCAGLKAPSVARSISGVETAAVPSEYFAKGQYYGLNGASPFRHLVYPVAHGTHLGVHVTLNLAGQARFGPDLTWVDSIDYRFDDSRLPQFVEAVRRYYPALRESDLSPGYTGIRPKITPGGAQSVDFVFSGPEQHGVPGLLNLFGFESPGLTAALAIGEHVAERLAGGRRASSPDAAGVA